MGEAKARKAQATGWIDALTGDERVVGESARLIFNRVVKPLKMAEGCYYCAFLLRKYLKEERSIDVAPVVGWAKHANIAFPHAWIEYKNKRIDISLQQLNTPGVPTGDLLILDHVVVPGMASYEYLGEATDEIKAIVSASRIVFADHMKAVAADDEEIDNYFRGAPPQYSYAKALSRIRAR
jgi:hypothetical protein